MSPEMEPIASAFLGSAAFTSLLIALAMIGTLNPYHRPAIPFVGVAVVIFTSTYLHSIYSGTPLDMMTLRTNLVGGGLSMFDLVYLGFMILTILLMQATLRRRPEDPLIALSDAESGSE
ncbi:MAG: hypothetical protein VX204_01720 [Candidatus Thermoplasmatota archaeon]|nr:hypothetical protein [Candidatus Thermoplasmatota archaeon]MEE3269814.1 hypothetical protein [Candidatus Thermoplasmatota archaeon]